MRNAPNRKRLKIGYFSSQDRLQLKTRAQNFERENWLVTERGIPKGFDKARI